jgi:DNA-binding CsgD family transcriptional regulator
MEAADATMIRGDGRMTAAQLISEPATEDFPGLLALNWLGGDESPRLICTNARRLVWSNAAADRALAEAGGLRLDGNVLEATTPASQPALNAFIAGCGAALAGLVLPTVNGDGHLLVRAREIGRHRARRFVGLTFLVSGSGFQAHYQDMKAAFGLTNAEHRVLIELAEGRTADEIAEGDRLSVNTVRCHIRNIYAKLDVGSREALFGRIRAYRVL